MHASRRYQRVVCRARVTLAREDDAEARNGVTRRHAMDSIRNWAGGYERVGEVNKVRRRVRAFVFARFARVAVACVARGGRRARELLMR